MIDFGLPLSAILLRNPASDLPVDGRKPYLKTCLYSRSHGIVKPIQKAELSGCHALSEFVHVFERSYALQLCYLSSCAIPMRIPSGPRM